VNVTTTGGPALRRARDLPLHGRGRPAALDQQIFELERRVEHERVVVRLARQIEHQVLDHAAQLQLAESGLAAEADFDRHRSWIVLVARLRLERRRHERAAGEQGGEERQRPAHATA
jgi:hypothetical protein